MARITATIDNETEKRARAKAALEGKSLPKVVRELVEKYVQDGLPGYREENENEEKEA